MEQSRNVYRVLVGKSEERPLRRLRFRWEDNIKMDLSKVGYDAADWIDHAQDRVENLGLTNLSKLLIY